MNADFCGNPTNKMRQTMRVKEQVLHYPSLRTVLMIEDALKNANGLVTREELKQMLETKVMHQTLNVALEYLEDSGKILDGRKGILWIHNNNKKLKTAVEDGNQIN